MVILKATMSNRIVLLLGTKTRLQGVQTSIILEVLVENLKFARNWNFEIFAKKIRQIEVSSALLSYLVCEQTFTSFFAISEF